MTDPQGPRGEYALTLSEAEVARYRVMAEAAHADEADLWQLAGIAPGARMADIGCGPGALLPALSAAVGPLGRVIGIDGDPPSVAAAQALVVAAALDNVSVRAGRAEDTGLEPGSLDVVMMRHVLAHNGPREQDITNHAASLLRPGGCLFLVDADGYAIRVRPSDPDIEDLMFRYQQYLAMNGNDFLTGLRLDTRLRGAGLEVLQYRGWYNIIAMRAGLRPPAWAARDRMVAAGVATDADVARWDSALREADEHPPTIFAPTFAAIGRKPS